MPSIESDDFAERMRAAISLGWTMFSRKVGSGLLPINKEASMQLQYAYVLQQLVPLIKFHKDENFAIELETGMPIDNRTREIDLLFSGHYNGRDYIVAVEMKCYRTLASSGGMRGATDIFMKDLYFDLFLLERYVASNIASAGVSLVMTDMERLVNPKQKNAKCWRYDISHGAQFGAEHFDTPIGGKSVDFALTQRYELQWTKQGHFWFLETEGRPHACGINNKALTSRSDDRSGAEAQARRCTQAGGDVGS